MACRTTSYGLAILSATTSNGTATGWYPVNPREATILGETCYPRLEDVPVPVDIVNVFRAPDALPGIAGEAVAIHADALWCQFGVINEEGAKIAELRWPHGHHGPLPQG